MRNPQPLTLCAYIWDSPSRSAGRTSIHSLQNLGIQLYITNRFLFSLLTQGCSKNFRILVTGWSHQTKNYSIFSKNLPSAAMHFATRWIHLFYSSAQVDLGLSSTALGNARHASSALSNRIPFSCLFSSGNRKKSQGERSGEYGGYGSSCTSLSLRKSTVVAAVCALALSWWRKRPPSPVFGRRWHQTSKTLGRQWRTYQSAVTIRLSSREMVVT